MTRPRSSTPSLIAPILAALIIAGCVDPVEQEQPVLGSGVWIDEERPDTDFGEVATGPVAQPDLNATLDAAPKLIAGEWWRLRFANSLSGSEERDVVRVVAAVEPGGYIVGMPHEGWAKELISYHSPALGDVGLDLSYPVHNEIFQPVKFPLTVGATWETTFALAPYVGKVESVEGTKASITLTPTGEPQPTDPVFALFGFSAVPITIVYDASMHEVVKFGSSIGGYEVVEHGYDYAGWVTIPRGEHTAIDTFQLGPASQSEIPGARTIPVSGGYNRMTLLQGIFPLGPGVYKTSSIAPDGTEFVAEAINEPVIKFSEARDPDGAWTLENTIVGPAATYSMGIAYHQYDIRLPDGARRSDHSHPVVQ